MEMCSGTEHVNVEALLGKGGWGGDWGSDANVPPETTSEEVYSNEWSGSLSNQTIGGAGYNTEAFVKQYAHEKNEDGSYLSEGQLRVRFGTFMRQRFCDNFNHCNGICCAMPGDTLFWEFEEYGRVATRYEPGTDEELAERGWLQQGPGGLLHRYYELYREDPSQLDDDDEDGSDASEGNVCSKEV